MKRYLLFAGATCYPSGGAQDLICAFTSLQDAIKVGKSKLGNIRDFDWYHVYDVTTDLIVASEGQTFRDMMDGV